MNLPQVRAYYEPTSPAQAAWHEHCRSCQVCWSAATSKATADENALCLRGRELWFGVVAEAPPTPVEHGPVPVALAPIDGTEPLPVPRGRR